jgi:hypothetical protein
MPLEPPDVWKSTFAQLPLVKDANWAGNVAKWLNERLTGKLQLAPILGPVTFTFQVGIFESQLKPLPPVDKALDGASHFATALEAALQASQMMVTPGCCLVAPVPPTLWSVVTTVIDASSVQTVKQTLQQSLTGAAEVDDGMKSSVAMAFRNAIMMLTCTSTGINCVTPTPGPLLSPFTPVT